MIPTFKSVGCFSDFWKEAEKLVDEGLVRSLSINAATIHQIESLLEFARHRPVMASFESSPLAPLPEMVAFLKQNRIVPRAHVALCKGEALDLECLKRSDMTPAQAALLWHTQQGVIPCFGNDTLAHIDENLKAQTAELMGLPPVVAPIPARNLLKLYPTMSMNMHCNIIHCVTHCVTPLYLCNTLYTCYTPNRCITLCIIERLYNASHYTRITHVYNACIMRV